MVLMVCKPTIVLVYLRLGLELFAAPWRFAYRHGIYEMKFCVQYMVQPWMNASKSETQNLVQCLHAKSSSQSYPCQDLLQPCGHKTAVDSSLEIFNLQNFILALVLPDDDIAKSAVTIEGDRRS